MSALVSCNNLTKTYGKNKTAVNHMNLEIEGGHIIGLLGPNGSGKTTLIKMLCGLLTPTSGEILVNGKSVGVESKKVISYLPDQTYLEMNQKVSDVIRFFETFYADFDPAKAYSMLADLQIHADTKLKTMSKGTKEKMQLVLVMSRKADLYILDEPIAGVDPAARDYILRTILTNYEPSASILISTHLISDVENVLDQVLFIKDGQIVKNQSVDEIRMEEGMSVDMLFREVFKC